MQNFVCPHCVIDSPEIENWIKINSVIGECSFCDLNEARQDFNICVPLNLFAQYCAEIITSKYVRAEDEGINIAEIDDSLEKFLPLRMIVEEEFSMEGQEIRHSEIIDSIIDIIGDPDDIWFPNDFFE